MKNKNTLMFITNDFVTALGNSIFMILIIWYVYDITGSGVATAVIGSFTHICSFFAGPVAGVYADRSKNPLSLLRWTLRINGILVIFMITNLYFSSGNNEIWAIFILVALREITFSLEKPSQTRIIPMIVPVDYVSKLIGYRSISSNIADLIGNSISGFLIASIGIIGGLIFNSITFFIGSVLIGFIRILSLEERTGESPELFTDGTVKDPINSSSNDVTKQNSESKINPSKEKKQGNFKKEIFEGFRYIWENKYIRKITIITTIINVSSMIGPILVVYFSDFLNRSIESYGIFNAALTGGSILSGLIIGKLNMKLKNSTIVLMGWSFLSIILIFMFFDVHILVTYFFGFSLGIGLTLPSITLNTVMVLIIPDSHRGRVSTIIQAIAVVLIPLFNIIGGVISDVFGANYVFLIAGLWIVIVVFIVFKNRYIFNIDFSKTSI